MPTAINIGGLDLNVDPIRAVEPIDWGTADLLRFLANGDARVEEWDQLLAEARYLRQIRVPLRIESASMDAAVANQQAILAKLRAASRLTPITLTVTPVGRSTVSSFKIVGGALTGVHDNLFEVSHIDEPMLELQALPWCYGAAQNLGSSGSPLASNVTSPALVTVTPSPIGDVPADIIVYVKNRGPNPARSLMVSTVSGNTTWTPQVDSSSWTTDSPSGPTITTPAGPPTTVLASGTFHQNVVNPIAHWTQPTLPTDRRFVVWLRARDNTTTRGTLQFRLRHVTGSNQVIGAWRSIPVDASPNTFQGVKMGSWPFPLSQISQAGAATTTTYLEVLSLTEKTGSGGIEFDFALYQPEDSTVVFETEDTSTALVSAAGTVQVESDMCFSTTGQPAGTVAIGAHVRAVGSSRYCVTLSQGFLAGLDSILQWDTQPVDVYSTVTPRYWGLA